MGDKTGNLNTVWNSQLKNENHMQAITELLKRYSLKPERYITKLIHLETVIHLKKIAYL